MRVASSSMESRKHLSNWGTCHRMPFRSGHRCGTDSVKRPDKLRTNIRVRRRWKYLQTMQHVTPCSPIRYVPLLLSPSSSSLFPMALYSSKLKQSTSISYSRKPLPNVLQVLDSPKNQLHGNVIEHVTKNSFSIINLHKTCSTKPNPSASTSSLIGSHTSAVCGPYTPCFAKTPSGISCTAIPHGIRAPCHS